jgi:hypothetical protein
VSALNLDVKKDWSLVCERGEQQLCTYTSRTAIFVSEI